MKTLPEILRDVLLLLPERSPIVISRGDHDPLNSRCTAYQMRFTYLAESQEYLFETRGWLGEQWSNWYPQRGWLGGASFDSVDVLARDWRIS